MSVALRRARPDDREGIARLEERLFPEDAWSRAMIEAELTGPHGYYLVAEELGETDDAPSPALLGYAGLLAPEGAAQADVQTLAVEPASRRRGLGRTLLRALIAEAAQRGAREVFLEVRADNEGAQQLYLAEGFERIGTRPRYYGAVDAVVMRHPIAASRPSPAVGS